MKHIKVLTNKIQNYPWGSYKAIPELMGQKTPSDIPQAELWMGAHPKASSDIMINGTKEPLVKIIEKHPKDILGEKTAAKFNNTLPYLFKILAAEKPLSIQAHPDKKTGIEGYARENALGIPMDAPNRNYKDENHKPECICALTPFWALNGFRKIKDILLLLEQVWCQDLENEYKILKEQQNHDGLKAFFNTLMRMETHRQKDIIEHIVNTAKNLSKENIILKWIIKLNKEYPLDVGVLSPILLNLVCLHPGEAMFLNAGTLHAYLDGMGIEIMANSDNVLRGGLTSKHVDLPELLNLLNFETKEIKIILPDESDIKHEKIYKCSADEFALSVITLKNEKYTSATYRNVEIIICTSGKAEISEKGTKKTIPIKKGESVIIPAATEKYFISGNSMLYKAGVPT